MTDSYKFQDAHKMSNDSQFREEMFKERREAEDLKADENIAFKQRQFKAYIEKCIKEDLGEE